MQGSQAELDAFVRKYERLARAKVRNFVARNHRQVCGDLHEDLLQSAFVGIVQAFYAFDKERNVPERIYVAMKIDYALLQEFDRCNIVSSADIAKIGRLKKAETLLEKLYYRPVSKEELALFMSLSDKEIDAIWQLANIRSLQIDEQPAQMKSINSSLDAAIYRRELLARVRKAVLGLSAKEKFIVKLLYVDLLSLGKAGELLGVCKQSVAGARGRILRKIRKALSDEGIAV